MRYLAAVCVLLALPACAADITAPSDARLATAAQGDWVAEQGIRGNYLGFTLKVSDTTVTGTGAFAWEAGPSGTVAVVGGATQSKLTLHFTYTATLPTPSTSVARFTGTLDANGLLAGNIQYGPESGMQPEFPITFQRPILLAQ